MDAPIGYIAAFEEYSKKDDSFQEFGKMKILAKFIISLEKI